MINSHLLYQLSYRGIEDRYTNRIEKIRQHNLFITILRIKYWILFEKSQCLLTGRLVLMNASRLIKQEISRADDQVDHIQHHRSAHRLPVCRQQQIPGSS